jgi:hypothetical protein
VEDELRFAVEQAVLAPSSHNTQPWQFRLDGDTVELYADRDRVMHVIDPQDRELVISCGAALLNIELAIQHCARRSAESSSSTGAPQVLLRLGYAPRTRATPRRPVSEVVIQ